MLKKVGYQVEVFNGYCDVTREVGDQMQEVCFDIQVLLVEFFTNAVRCVRGECEGEHGLSPQYFTTIAVNESLTQE